VGVRGSRWVALETEHGTRRTLVLELCVPDLFVRVEDMGGVGERGGDVYLLVAPNLVAYQQISTTKTSSGRSIFTLGSSFLLLKQYPVIDSCSVHYPSKQHRRCLGVRVHYLKCSWCMF
jgi:hypothetical protein